MGERREKGRGNRRAKESKSEGNVETSIKLPALWIVFNLRIIKKHNQGGCSLMKKSLLVVIALAIVAIAVPALAANPFMDVLAQTTGPMMQ